jgi:cytochrome c553
MSAAKHAFVPTTCDTCHETGLTFYLGASTPLLQGRPADHLSSSNPQQVSGDCSGCHETTDWNTTALPAGHMPNPGNQVCATCHTAAPGNFATLAANSVLHTGITSGCAQCHGGATALTFYNNNDNPKSGVLTPPHIPAFSGSDCSSCHSSTTYAVGSFGPMNMTQATHSTVGTTCNRCHEAGLNFYMGAANPGLQGRPADHTSGQMVAPNDCSLCHTTANWNSTSLPAGHMPNPANQACAVCHPKSPSDYTPATLAANAILHTGITSTECAQCHGGTTALTWYNNFTPKDAVLSPPHIPFLAGSSCGSCHSSTNYAVGGFGPMNMTQATHSVVTTTCITCHEVGTSFYMGAASPGLQRRPLDHTSGQMVAPNDCSLCHTTANWNSTALPAGHMPNPANQACAVCHTKAPADYTPTTLAANPVLHTGISSGCIRCHGAPNAAPPVFYNNYTPKDALLSPVHIPTSTTPCESCHLPTVFTSFSGTSMTSAKHTAMFAVIGGTCDACHNRVTPALIFYGVSNLQTRPGSHNSGRELTNDCSGCHNTNGWGGGAATKKSAAPQAAPNARVGIVVRAPGGSSSAAGANPLGAVARAGIAPAPTGFGTQLSVARPGTIQPAMGLGTPAGLRPTHFGVTSNCFSCHNSTLATGKGPTHITSNTACENCHTTMGWLPARFDHRGVLASCVSCHNGALSPGKPAQHIQTAQDCGTCHNTIDWKSVTFSHVGINGTCQSCHNGVTATGKQIQHASTTQDCGGCHNTLNWTITTPPKPLRPLVRGVRGAPGGPRQ